MATVLLANAYHNLPTLKQHTKNCIACLGALKRIEQCILATKVLAVLSLAWAMLKAASAVSMNIAVSMAQFAPGAPPPPLASIVLVRAMLPGVLVGLVSLWATKVRLRWMPCFVRSLRSRLNEKIALKRQLKIDVKACTLLFPEHTHFILTAII